MGGLTQTDWAALLARLSVGFARATDAGGSPAAPHLPGADPANRVTGMEGFSRMLVPWGAWLSRAENPTGVRHGDRSVDLLDLVVRGLSDGTDPAGRHYWGDIHDRDQQIVEAAEIAFGLWMGRERLEPALGAKRLAQVLAWLAQVHGRDVYADNWVLFPSIVAAVRRGLGVRVPDHQIDPGIDRMLRWYRGDGWYSDGDGHAFDRYTGWAVHWHLLHWAEIDGDRRPRVRDRVRGYAATWLRDLPALAAADGAIPLFGRSLGYRFATTSLLGLAAVMGLSPVAPGLARHVMSASISHHLAHGAIDDATDWFRVGVHGRRPDVCERYMSAGASAWATRILVPLALGPDHAFWTAPEEPVPAQVTDGERVLRGPGFLVGRERASGSTWVASALMDHPDDIPGHDYRPSYGKALFHSAFAYTDRAADGHPGPDGALVLEAGEAILHRDAVDAGGVGPGWAWSRYRLRTGGAAHRVTSISLRSGDTWVRAVALRPGGQVRAVTATLPLGVANASRIRRIGVPNAAIAAATDGERWVAIRSLIGYDEVVESGPARDGPDRNLAADHSEQPSVRERGPRGSARLLVSADVARARDVDPCPDLAGIVVEAIDHASTLVRFPSGERARLDGAWRPSRQIDLDGWIVTGPALRVVRLGPNGEWFGGESITEIEGVVRLDRPGPVEVRKGDDGRVLVGTISGMTVAAAWTGRPMTRVALLGPEGWGEPTTLAEPGVIPTRLVRSLQRATGHTFVELRLEP